MKIGVPFFLVFVLLVIPPAGYTDSFSVLRQSEISLPERALDLAVSDDGRWIFVLMAGGRVSVFDPSGAQIQVLEVGEGYDSIEYNTSANQLILGNSGNRSLKNLTLAMIFDLDYQGSPVKGLPGAPVTIAMFDDFQ